MESRVRAVEKNPFMWIENAPLSKNKKTEIPLAWLQSSIGEAEEAEAATASASSAESNRLQLLSAQMQQRDQAWRSSPRGQAMGAKRAGLPIVAVSEGGGAGQGRGGMGREEQSIRACVILVRSAAAL